MKKSTKIIVSLILSVVLITVGMFAVINFKNKLDMEKAMNKETETESYNTTTNTQVFYGDVQTTSEQYLVKLPVQTDAEKLQTVADAINRLKSGQVSFAGEGSIQFDVSISDCSVSLLTGEALKKAKEFASSDWDFSMKSATPQNALEILPPYGKQCQFQPDGVTSVTSRVSGYQVIYTITLKYDYSDATHADTVHSAAIGSIDFSNLKNVKYVDRISYDATVIEATFDMSNNEYNLESYTFTLPVEVDGVNGEIGGIYGSADFDAVISHYWRFSY